MGRRGETRVTWHVRTLNVGDVTRAVYLRAAAPSSIVRLLVLTSIDHPWLGIYSIKWASNDSLVDGRDPVSVLATGGTPLATLSP